jgi:putative endonuclease
MSSWYVYIVECCDATLYTGITTNIEKRIREHNTSRLGAKYTRARRPVVLVYIETSESRSSASRREYQIKQMK